MTQQEEYYLPQSVHFIRIDEDLAVLSGPTYDQLLEGESIELVAESITLFRDGTTANRLAEKLDITHQAAKQLIARLQDKNLVRQQVEKSNVLTEWMSSRPMSTQKELAGANIGILTEDPIPASPPESLERSISTKNIGSISALAENRDRLDLLLSVVYGESPRYHHAILEETWEEDIQWLPIRFVDSEIKLGPYSTPSSDICYNCYYKRLLASSNNRKIAEQKHQHIEQSERRLYPLTVNSIIWNIAHIELISIFAPDRSPKTAGGIITIDMIDMQMGTNEILKLPGCEICGMN